jgi:hypothetical protein
MAKRPGPGDAWMEYSILVPDARKGIEHISLCGLCSNTGIIKTKGTFETFGRGTVTTDLRAYCICPNGRVKRKRFRHSRTKWGGSSIIGVAPPVRIYRDRQ